MTNETRPMTEKSFLTSKDPGQQAAQIRQAITAAEAELADFKTRRPGAMVRKLVDDRGAAAEVEAIDGEIRRLDAHLADLRDAQHAVQQLIAEAAAESRRSEAEARPRRIAELRHERMELARKATEAMAVAAAAVQAMAANGSALIHELGDQASLRFLSFQSFTERCQSAFARVFAIDASAPLGPRNSLLGIASYERGERSQWTAAQHEETGLDDLAPFFLDETEAKAAKERRAARNSKTVIVALPGGCLTLVPVERVFGDRDSAQHAARTGQAIVPHDGGYVVMPDRFTGEVA
jgi:hypothetical protein